MSRDADNARRDEQVSVPAVAGAAQPSSGRVAMQAPARRGPNYVSHAIRHPYNLVMLAVSLTLAMISGSPTALLMIFIAEMLVLLLVPRSRTFRTAVDQVQDEQDRAEAAAARAQLLVQMGEDHRRELNRLEMLVARIQENNQRYFSPVRLLCDDGVDLEQLLSTFIRIAIAHKACRDYLSSTPRQQLEHDIRMLEAARLSAPDRLRQLEEQRLEIARKRIMRWDRTRENLEVFGQQLAMISELLHLMQEQSVAPINTSEVTNEIERLMTQLEDHECTVRELALYDEDDSPALLPVGLAAVG